MRSLNKVMLIGHLGTDPELRSTTGGQAVASFTLATNESWGGRDGAPRQERTEWHRIVVWGRLAEIANEYLRKGRQLYVEGRLQTRQWNDQQGNKRYTTEVIAQNFLMLGRGAGETPGADGPEEMSGPGVRGSRRGSGMAAGGLPEAGGETSEAAVPDFLEDDSDLPF